MCGDIQLPFNLKKASAYDQNIGKIANSPRLVSREPTPLVQNHFFSFRTTPSHSKPPLLIQNHPFSFRTTPSHSGPPLLTQNHPFSFRTTPCHSILPLALKSTAGNVCNTRQNYSSVLYCIHVCMFRQWLKVVCTHVRMYTVRVTE